MTDTIRIGILGAARIAPSALLSPASKRKEVSVVCVAARDPLRAKVFGAEHGLIALAGYEALLERDDLNLIYNALPPAAHRFWSIQALRSGKAVLCEKPFALNAAEAREMVVAARAAQRPLIEAFHYRYHEAMIRAISLVKTGKLGRIVTARADFCTEIPQQPGELRWSAEQGGGAVMDLGCYPVHALRSLLGADPIVESANAVYLHGVEAEASANLLFPGGIRAQMHCSMISTQKALSLEVVGECGQLTLSNYIVPQFGCSLRTVIEGVVADTPICGPSTYDAQLAHVIDVLSHDVEPMTGGADAIANMATIDAIRKRALRKS